MESFVIYTPESANDAASGILQDIREKIGFAPNMFAVMGGAPAALTAFVEMNRAVTRSRFDPTEAEIIQTAASVANLSPYCVAGHTAFAAMQQVDAGTIAAVRRENELTDARHEALRRFTQRLVESRGHMREQEIAAFIDAGFDRDAAIEVIMVVALKFFSNLVGNMTNIPLDDAFARFEWKPETSPAVAA